MRARYLVPRGSPSLRRGRAEDCVTFDGPAASRAAEIRAELLRLGRVKSHVDVMIAGIARSGRHTLISRDADFKEIGRAVGLVVES